MNGGFVRVAFAALGACALAVESGLLWLAKWPHALGRYADRRARWN